MIIPIVTGVIGGAIATYLGFSPMEHQYWLIVLPMALISTGLHMALRGTRNG